MKLALRIVSGTVAVATFLLFMYLLFSPWPFELTVIYMRSHLWLSTVLYGASGFVISGIFYLSVAMAVPWYIGNPKRSYGWFYLALAIFNLALLVFNSTTFPHPLWEGYVEKDSTYVLYARQTVNYGFQFGIWGLLAIRYLRAANRANSHACPADSGCPA